MPPATSRAHIAAIDERGDSRAGANGFANLVNTRSLSQEIRDMKAIQRNRVESQPYRDYIKSVIKTAEVTDSQLTRQLASNVCGYVAALPFLPSKTEIIDRTSKVTEYDAQIAALARAAEEQVRSSTGTVAVMIVPARRLAQAALDLRIEDPDGSKGIAWVNPPLPEESDLDERYTADLAGEEDGEPDIETEP